MPGYSGTPLPRKLGIKPGFRIYARNPPENYATLVAPLPVDTTVLSRPGRGLDLIHLFVTKLRELERGIDLAKTRIHPDGMIWVSWPKKSSGVPSEVTEDTVRAVALPTGLVDVKVCAVDETWSGLKLVVRRELRAGWGPD